LARTGKLRAKKRGRNWVTTANAIKTYAKSKSGVHQEFFSK
jgi:hypothetical protein